MTDSYVGVDWVTMTSDDEQAGHSWWKTYREYRDCQNGTEGAEREFSNGYYSGVRIAHMSWGYSETLGYILVVSGQDANYIWPMAYPVPHRVTRVDLAVDIGLNAASDLARANYQHLSLLEDDKRRSYSLFINNRGGSTLYVGSRHSMQYGRLYDKGVESGCGDPGEYWRFEVEYKKPIANGIIAELAKIDADDRATAIKDTVGAWYQKRRVDLPDVFDSSNAIDIMVQQRITTADKKLTWLRTQVQPTVRMLVEAGYGKDVMHSLMLDENTLKTIMNQNV